MIKAVVDEKLKNLMPGFTIGHIEIDNITVKKTPERIKKLIREAREGFLGKYSESNITHAPFVNQYRDFIRKFGADPTQEKAAAEALMRMLINKGRLPDISNVVDCMNLVSVKRGLTMSCWDKDKIRGEVAIRLSNSGERYRPIGRDEMSLMEGEVIEADSEKILCLIRFRDSSDAAITESTQNILMHIQGVPGTDFETVKEATAELRDLLLNCTGGTLVKENIISW